MNRRTAVVAALIVAASLASAAYAAWPTHPPAPPAASQLDSTGQGTFHRKDGVPLLTVTNKPATPASPDCPADTLCLYAAPDFGYPRVTTTACGHIDLSWIGWARRPRSIHNNLPAGGHPKETVGFFRADAGGGPPSEATEHLLLMLTASTRTAENAPPDIDWLYHRC